jgi:hypothetical protein
MALTITKLEPQRRNPDLVDLHVDGEFRSAVAYAAVEAERIRTALRRERKLAAFLARRAYRPGAVRTAVQASLRGRPDQ